MTHLQTLFIVIATFWAVLPIFLVHEVFIHRRLKFWRDTKSVYWLAVRKAHMQHHRHVDREDGECFGMRWVAHRYLVDARRALGRGTQ